MSDLPDAGLPPDAPADPDPALAARFPWPPPEDESLITALGETWRRAVFQPRPFYAALPDGGTGAAVLYYLVVGIAAAALQLFWDTVLPYGGDWLGLLDPGTRISPLVNFLLSPLYLIASLVLAGGVTHLVLLVLVREPRGFGTTVRVYAYAYSPMLFAVVPRVGALIGFIWMVVIAVIGVREAHRTTTGRAATAVLVPLVLALVLIAAAALLLAAGAVLLTHSGAVPGEPGVALSGPG